MVAELQGQVELMAGRESLEDLRELRRAEDVGALRRGLLLRHTDGLRRVRRDDVADGHGVGQRFFQDGEDLIDGAAGVGVRFFVDVGLQVVGGDLADFPAPEVFHDVVFQHGGIGTDGVFPAVPLDVFFHPLREEVGKGDVLGHADPAGAVFLDHGGAVRFFAFRFGFPSGADEALALAVLVDGFQCVIPFVPALPDVCHGVSLLV